MKHVASFSYSEVQRRDASEGDDEYLFGLFTASRHELLAAVASWDASQRETFMRLQYTAQQTQYRQDYPQASWEVIVSKGEVIGQIVIAMVDDALRLVDISVLPAWRNCGIGSALLRDLLDRAIIEHKRVTLYVLQGSPAVRLYRRLGFSEVATEGLYLQMQSLPEAAITVQLSPPVNGS